MGAKPESTLRSSIVRRLRARGWLPLVQHGSAWTGPGRSDLLVCARGRFVALEIKTAIGRPTPAQMRFLASVRAAGGLAAVVRSADEAERCIDGGLPVADAQSLDDFLNSLTLDEPTAVAEHEPEPEPVDVAVVETIEIAFALDDGTTVGEQAVEAPAEVVFNPPMDAVVQPKRLTDPTLYDVYSQVADLADRVAELCTLLAQVCAPAPKRTRKAKGSSDGNGTA